MFNSPSHFRYAKRCSAVMQNSVREIRYDCLTTRPISSCKSRIFRSLSTYTSDLRVPTPKKKSQGVSHMVLVAIDDHHYAR